MTGRERKATSPARARMLLRVLLSWATIAAPGGAILTAAEAAPPAGKEEARAKPTLTPALEAKLAEYLKKAREAKRGLFAKEMKKRIENIARVTGLDAERMNALERPAEQAMELSLDEWVAKARDGWRTWAEQMGNQPAEVFDQVLAQVQESVQIDWFGDYVHAFEQPKWEEGLRAVLTPAQMSAWLKSEQDRRQAAQKELAGPLKDSMERSGQPQRIAFGKKADAIKSALHLSQERAAALDALVGSIVDASAQKWRARAERMLLEMDDDQRRQVLKTGKFYIRTDVDDAKAQEDAWEAGVAKLLSEEEKSRLHVTQDAFRERRSAALAQILIAQLDEQVAFTASQRDRLRPFAEREVRATPALTPDSEETYYQISLPKLLACGRAIKETELEPILDATQRKRWQEACSAKNSAAIQAMGMVRIVGRGGPVAPATPAPRPGEPEDIENAVSDHLFEKATTERQRLLALNLLRAEDAARVAALSPEAVLRLATAARGTAEEELATWKTSAEQTIRSQLQDVTPENVKQRLASLDRYSFSRRRTPGSAIGALWEATIAAELTDVQRAAWQKELDARAAHRDQAIATLIVTEFDRRVSLSSEQWQKIQPRLVTIVKEYGPDIGTMFSYSYGNAWYLQSHSLFLPITAVPENELRTLLTKEQWERWMGSPEIGNLANYWENIERNHANRVKEKKE